MNMLTRSLSKSVSTSSHKSISTMKSDESATYSSLSTVLALAKESHPDFVIIKKNLPLIVDENLTEYSKVNALKQCVKAMDNVLGS